MKNHPTTTTHKQNKQLYGESEDWETERRNYRQTIVALLNDSLFLGSAETDRGEGAPGSFPAMGS
eukprot:1951472-Pyramimonas_sp.AAC.1